MRRVTRSAALCFHGRVLIGKWSLLICVTLHTRGIRASCESGLFKLKASVRIVTIAALHRAFQHLVVKGQLKLVLHFGVATQTQLRLVLLQESHGRQTRFLCVALGRKDV